MCIQLLSLHAAYARFIIVTPLSPVPAYICFSAASAHYMRRLLNTDRALSAAARLFHASKYPITLSLDF